jgi:hypothetical protein
MANQLPTHKKPRILMMVLSWLVFGFCLVVVLGEILGFQLSISGSSASQQITAHHHHGILDMQTMWNEMEILYHAP